MSLGQRIFTERRRVILPLVIFLAANLVALGVVFYLDASLNALRDSKQDAIAKLDAARKDEASAKGQKTSKDLADVQLAKFYTEILPRNFQAARDIVNFWLGHIARQTRVSFRAGQYDSAAVRDSRLTKVSGDITLVGDYADIRRFLYEVETSQEFVIIEKVQLSQPNAIQGNDKLEVGLSIATYFLADGQPVTVSK